MYNYNRSLTILLILVLIISMGSISFAAPYNEEEQYLTNAVSDIIPQLMKTNLDANTKCSLGKALCAYKIEDGHITTIDYSIYPIIINDDVTAIAQLSQNDAGEYSVCCITSVADGIQAFYKNNPKESFCLVYAYEGVYIVDSAKRITLAHSAINESLTSIADIEMNWSNLKHTPLKILKDVSVSTVDLISQDNDVVMGGTRALQFMTLSVPYVPNATSTCSNCYGRGLCWAASIAMIINYYRGTSYSAKNIHDATGCYSDATPSNYKSAIRTFGAYAYGAYYTFNFSTIQTIVQGYHPAFMRIERTDSSGVEYGHIIVPYGYYYYPESSSTKYFYFMDPNYGGGIASFPTSGAVQISTNGYTYTFDYYIGTSW